MKELKRLFKPSVVLAMLLCFSIPTFSHAASSAYGPKEKHFGAGLYLGEPTGVTIKSYITERLAIDGILAWSFVHDAFTVIGDATYDFLHLPIHSSDFKVPFYAGFGARIDFVRNGPSDGQTRGGVRVPLGLAMQWINYPIEVFFELGPGMELGPETKFEMSGGIGARFYFF